MQKGFDWKKFGKTFVLIFIALAALSLFVPVFTLEPNYFFIAMGVVTFIAAFLAGLIQIPYISSFVGITSGISLGAVVFMFAGVLMKGVTLGSFLWAWIAVLVVSMIADHFNL